MRGFGLLLALAACGGGSPDRLPASTSRAAIPPPEAVVVADLSDVRVDGTIVATIGGDGLVGLKGDVVPALVDALKVRASAARAAAAADAKATAFRGAVSLELDRGLPAGVLRQIVASAAEAGFGKPWIVVQDPTGARYGVRLGIPTAAQAAAAAPGAAPATTDSGYANPTITLDASRGYRVDVFDRVVAGPDGAWLGCDPSPCNVDGWPTVELARLARRIKHDHPRDRGVVVAPRDDVPLQSVVTAFDATRDDALAGRGATELFPDALLGRP